MELNANIISGFSSSLLQKNYDGAVESPACHMEWWAACTSKHPKVAIAAPRRHAKSTAITLAYVLASVLFRNKSYVLIISDTITQATQFLNDIKKELVDNEKIVDLFHIGGFNKDTEDDIIVSFTDGTQFRISAKGAEQKMRGLKWNNKRPDLIVGDDLENDEIVMNSERRQKFKRWFYGAVVPSLAVSGVIRLVGTILHEDSLLSNLMPSIWDKHTSNTPLKLSSTLSRPNWLAYTYRAHTDDYTSILWPQRYDAEWFMRERADYMARGLADVYSQEWLNQPIDESVAFFKRNDFIGMQKDDFTKNMRFYIAGDLAISQAENADYSVFVVASVDEFRNIYVRNVYRERLDGKEIVDMVLNLQKIYEPEILGLEEMQVSKTIGPFLREEMIRTGIYPNMLLMKHGNKDKPARAKSIQARHRARTIKFDKSGDWYSVFEDELCKFPRGTKDDQVDAFAYIGLMLDSLIEAPTQQDKEEEEYQDELESSGINGHGKSAHTGY